MSNIPNWSNVPNAWRLSIYSGYMYVVNWDAGTISKIDLLDGSVVNSNWADGLVLNSNGLVIDSTGTYMYILTYAGTISKIQIGLTSGLILTSNWASGTLSTPVNGLIIDSTDSYMYVTNGSGTISQINMINGVIITTTWASGLNSPNSLIIDSTDTYMYVSNNTNNTISKINMINGSINNASWASGLTMPDSLIIDSTGTYMYVTNINNNTISKINMIDGSINNASFVSGLDYPGGLGIDGNYIYVASYNGGNIGKYYIGPPPLVCFKEGSKILTDKGYICIQDLRKGDLVKTFKHEYKPINMIGKREIYNLSLKDRIKDQLYKCSNEQFPEVFEPLIITGCHAILIDNCVTHKQIEQTKEVLGNTYFTDDKYRMPACIDKRTTVYEIEGTFMIYHIALDCDDYYMNYGIYANGLLVETCSKRYLKELSNMELINF